MDNLKPLYWLETYPAVLEALGTSLKRDPHTMRSDIAYDLAYIAGDHYNMDDDEVLATFISENF